MTAPSPARNRVSPLGDVIAVEGRGAWMGNRGRLHERTDTRDIVRNHQHKAWVTCVLSFRGRRVAQWDPHHYTPLFFFDEAVALAAGHRPCGECRHGAYRAYRDLWSENYRATKIYAKDMDEQLHRERLDPAGYRAAWRGLPDGAFVATDDGPAVVIGDHLAVFDRDTYSYRAHRAELPRPRDGTAMVLTPPSTVEVLRAGYSVQIAAV